MNLTSILLPLLLQSAQQGSEPLEYHVSIEGPLGTIDMSCVDPCKIQQVEKVENDTKTVITTEADEDEEAEEGQVKRKLQKGIEVRIRNRHAHFTFYSVVDAEGGPATRSQHSEFRIDRPLIELELHDHDVTLETAMDESERTDLFRKSVEIDR